MNKKELFKIQSREELFLSIRKIDIKVVYPRPVGVL